MKKIILILTLFLTTFISFAQEGFEGSATNLPVGWNIYQNAVGLNQTWSITSSSALVCFGNNAIQVNRENLSFTGTPLTSEDYLVTPLYNVPANGQFRFWSKQGTLGDQGGKYQLKISTNPDKSILSAYVLLKEWTENEMNTTSNVCQEQKFSIPASYTGQAVYLALVKVATQTSTAIVGDRWVVDNINLVSECLAPTAVNSSNIAGTSATLNWTNPSGGPQWGIVAVANGGAFDPLTAITVAAPAVTTVGGVRSYVLNNLTFGTPYQFWVRSMCTLTNTSDWIGPFNFQTLALGTVCADPIVVTSPLPYQNNNNTGNFSDLTDVLQSNSALCGATPVGTNYMAGNDVFYRYTATTSGLISIRLTPTSPNASLFVYPSCPTTGACLAGVANSTSNVRLINNFAVVAGTSYTIVISSALPTQTVGYTLLIQQENCVAPVGNIPTNITTTSADLSWSNPTGASSWQVAVQTLGSSVPTTPGTTVNSNTLYQPPLVAATQYQYWVRSECAPGVFSSWAGPYVFNTLICAPGTTCNHTFRMFSAAVGGFNGARMEVRQNGILVQTIGATYTSGTSNSVVVPLCPNVPFELFWTVPGTAPLNCGVSIINSFGQTIFTKPAGVSSSGQQVYTATVNCAAPVCNIAPITTVANGITINSATLNWTSPGTTNFDIFIVPFGNPAPTATTVPTYANVGPLTSPFSFATTIPLLADTRYTYYIRVVCAPDPSPWSNGTSFTTLPTCTRPLNINAISTTTTGATLTWDNGTATDSSWEILLVPSPTYTLPSVLPPVNPTVASGTILISPLTVASPYTINTLTPATIYFYYVRTVCSTSDKSTWAGPFAFNTERCSAADTCPIPYRFILTDSGNNGWNSGRMQIRQNGILVTTIGATIPDGGPRVVNVQLCPGIPFDLFWSVAGTNPDEIGISIQSPFADVLYTKLPGAGLPQTVLFSGISSCTPPTCQKPTTLTASNITATTAELNWTEVGTATQWQVYVVPFGGLPPVNGAPVAPVNSPPYYTVNTLPFVIPNLLPITKYTFYVRSLCSSTDVSTWTILNPRTFTTKPLNDECTNAYSLTVNPTRACATVTAGSTIGATASIPLLLPGVGCGTSDDDVWFKFTATSAIHVVNLNNIVGTPPSVTLNHSLFSGSCTGLNLVYCSATTSSVATNLVPNQEYYIRVYTSGNTIDQTANFNVCITTPPVISNHECATAILAPVNAGLECVNFAVGSLTGATASPEPIATCIGTPDDDVWFKFVATATTHYFELKNVVGTTTNLNHAIYSGDCNSLVLKYCSAINLLTSNNNTFLIGTTYYVRVWSNGNTRQDVSFNLCIGKALPPITANTTQFTKQQLIEDILLKTTCANVSNITFSTGSNFGSTNGIGYFNKSLSEFPFADGIVLSTGNAASVPGPNLTTLMEGNSGWPGDAELEAIVLAGTGTAMTSLNATKLEFDFIPISNQISFDFIFASEEYGGFQCAFSDSFAFILTNNVTGVAANLAVVPNTATPVSVVTIRNNIHNTGCASANPDFFGSFYGATGVNPVGAPINFNGMTIPMTASASVNPNQSYHIKMVVADRQDTSFDSAVFLEGGSFDIGNVSLGDDFLQSAGNAICLGSCKTLISGLNPANYNIKWFFNNVEIIGQTNPSLEACEAGIYRIKAQYLSTTCFAEDAITIEYFPDVAAGTPANLKICDPSFVANFNLNQNTIPLLSTFPSVANRIVTFHTSEADANANVNPILNTGAFTNTSNPQTIYARISNTTTNCKQIKPFTLTVQDLTPVFTLTGSLTYCPTGTTTISVLPTANNFALTDASYTWTFNGNPVVGQTASSLTINGAASYGNYTVTVNREGCKTTAAFVTSNRNRILNYTLTGNLTYCPTGTTTIAVLPTANNFLLSEATYSWTFNGNPILGQTNSSLLINGAAGYGNYTVSVDIEGCKTTTAFVVSNSNNVWDFTITSPTASICQTQSVLLSFTANNFVLTNPNAIYTWNAPNGTSTTGSTVNANQVGIYSLEVNIFGCKTTKTFTITANTNPIPIVLKSGCDGSAYKLEVNPVNSSYDPTKVSFTFTGPEVVLIPGTPNKAILKKPGTYTVKVTTIPDGCTSTETITIASVSCLIQQGISPNNDGMNENFDLSTLAVAELEIFNRYGTKVYNLANYTNQWIGQSNSGDTLPDGTYFYVIMKKDGTNLTGWIYINK